MSVVGRTVFYSKVKGKVVFNDWCLLKTTSGDFIEPFVFNRIKNNGVAYDINDDVDMITDLVEVDAGKVASMYPFSDNGLVWHSGNGQDKAGY